jgi:hypothetical protein
MSNENRIWSGIPADTYTAKLLFVLLEGPHDEIYIDETTCKLIKNRVKISIFFWNLQVLNVTNIK